MSSVLGFFWLSYQQRHDFQAGKREYATKKKVLPLDVVMRGMAQGTVMYKVKRHDKCFKRRYNVDIQNMRLNYFPTGKPFWRTKNNVVDIYDISDVRKGWCTDVFHEIEAISQQENSSQDIDPEVRALLLVEDNCFSVVIDIPRRVVNLVAPNVHTRDAWVRGLRHLVATCKNSAHRQEYNRWLKEQVRRADTNNNGALDFNETVGLLKQLNIEMDSKQAKMLFDSANYRKSLIDGADALEPDEFVRFYNSLTKRPELEELMKKYSVSRTTILGVEELQCFMLKEQKLELSDKDCEALIKHYESGEDYIEGYISQKGFQALMLSPEFDVFNKKHRIVYQDMTHPLHHYYIASSHNTYLMQNQLTGESSVEGYIQALLKGCRCLELDTWDGPDGEPVVYHGYTLTSRIYLKDILNSIKDYAFRNSQYPVILSIENHCTVPYQIKMAEYFTDILGAYLHTGAVSESERTFPSPEDLARKILIKGKKLNDKPDEVMFYLEEEEEQEDIKHYTQNTQLNEELPDQTDVPVQQAMPKYSGEVAMELSDLINYFSASRFVSFKECGALWKFQDMASFQEVKAYKLSTDQGKDFVDYNKVHFSRIYPKGTRADSSNYDPVPFWNVGCQLVALNYQTLDTNMLIYNSKFAQNGSCGYVLKPDFLYERYIQYDPVYKHLQTGKKLLLLRIISGQKLPKPNRAVEGEIVDPYVVIKVFGHSADVQKKKTRFIRNNGFNPVWNEMFLIQLFVPELAFIVFAVKDQRYLGKNELIGQFAIPFTSMGEGYRHVHLKDAYDQDLVPSTLFIHVGIETQRPSKDFNTSDIQNSISSNNQP